MRIERARARVLLGTIAVAAAAGASTASPQIAVADPPSPPAAAAAHYRSAPTSDRADPHDKDKQTRHAFALRRDDHYVAELKGRANAGASSVVESLGIVMTVEEAGEINARQAVAYADRPVIRTYFAAYPEVFAGVYLDHPAGGRLTALVTRDADQHDAALRKLVSNPDRLIVATVANSSRELSATNDKVHELDAEARRQGIDVVSIGGPEPENIVVISVSSPLARASEFFRDRLTPGTFVVRKGTVMTPDGNSGTAGPPWRGAHNIALESGSWGCGSAFTVYRDPPKVAARTYYLLTAGHCYLNGESVRQPSGTNTIGSTGQRCYSQSSCGADSILINMSQAQKTDEVIKTPNGNNFRVRFEQGQMVDGYGDSACISVGGYSPNVRNNWYCGSLLETSFDQSYVDPRVSGASASWIWLRKVTGVTTYPGDSGNPWFNGVQTNTSTALGVYVGRASDDNRPLYAHIYDAKVATNVDGVARTG